MLDNPSKTHAAEWLASIGARPWREQAMESPFVYITRYYRLNAGATFPAGESGVGGDLTYGAATSFVADVLDVVPPSASVEMAVTVSWKSPSLRAGGVMESPGS